jgi:uncharacterized membrane protein
VVVGRDADMVAMGVLLQHMVLAGAVFWNRTLIKHQLLTLITSFALTTLWFRICFESSLYEVVMIIFMVCYGALSAWLWKNDKERLPYFLTVVSYSVLFYLISVFDQALSSLLLVEGLIAMWLGYVIQSKLQRINAVIIYAIGGLTALYLLYEGMDRVNSINSVTWLVLIATLYGINRLIQRYNSETWIKDLITTIYIALAAVILLFITDFTQAATNGLSDNAEHLWISAAWAIYSISVILNGVLKDKKKVRLVGLLLLFLTLIKVIFIDLPFVSIVIRAVLFIGLGAVGIIMSRFFYSSKK